MPLKGKALFLCAMAVAFAQSPYTPDWQKAAGGRMSFEVASVKPTKVPPPPSPVLAGEARTPGGRLSVTATLDMLINFAYKLRASPEQERILTHLPQSVSGFYEIEAKAAGNPTKDQMRLMMQSLLADRFKLKVHFETRDAAVLIVRLVRSGQIGPKLRRHDKGLPCPDTDPPLDPFAQRSAGEAFPPSCGIVQLRQTRGMRLIGARDITMASLAEAIYTSGNTAGEVERPVLDGTGLEGRFDFTLEFAPGENDRLKRSFLPFSSERTAEAQPPDSEGPTFLDAVRKQLGLKLAPDRGAIQVLVVDQVERPSEN